MERNREKGGVSGEKQGEGRCEWVSGERQREGRCEWGVERNREKGGVSG